MDEIIKLDGITYSVRYDEHGIKTILEQLGIDASAKFVLDGLVFYACSPRKLKSVWLALSLKYALSPSTVAVHLRNTLISAEYNGGLKNIDDILGVEFYDYDFGLTSKNFLAVLSRHLRLNDYIVVKNVEK